MVVRKPTYKKMVKLDFQGNGLSDKKNPDFFSSDLHNQQVFVWLYKTQKKVIVVYPHGFLKGVQW